MDIKHLEYFVEIVNSKFNLSVASKRLEYSLTQVGNDFLPIIQKMVNWG